MTAPVLIVVHGPPASGKTRLSQWLARELQLPLISRDTIKEALFGHFDFQTVEQSDRIDAASYDLLWAWLDALMVTGERGYIVETAFVNSIGEPALTRLLERHGHRVVQMFCHANEPVLRQRYVERAKTSGRHPGHKDLQNVENQPIPERSSFRPMNLPGDLLDIDTSNLNDVDYQEILDRLTRLIPGISRRS